MKKTKTTIKESDLAKVVIDYLTQPANDIYSEVPSTSGTVADIVIKRGDDLIAIETKTTFGLAVIAQAHHNKKHYNYVYVAVPLSKTSFALTVCREFGIGVIVVDWKRGKRVYEELKPTYNENPKKPKLRDWMKRSISGSQSDRLTSFKVFLESVEEQLACNGSMTHKELFKTCYRHYMSAVYLRTNLVTHIKSGLIKNIEYKTGKFTLTEKPSI